MRVAGGVAAEAQSVFLCAVRDTVDWRGDGAADVLRPEHLFAGGFADCVFKSDFREDSGIWGATAQGG